ncbi:tRNA pseudouridine(55) synthase, partial [candidate division KSB1 bacterium]|nr:tRNA pseudouridine(55) synthase [candidate division KSB1 bacterium]
INSQPVPQITVTEFKKVCQQFIGEIPQIPPMFSAKKIGGKRLYKIARQGEVVERQPAIVNIHSIDIIDFKLPDVTIKVVCSRGTYIRALARDIGKQIGCGGHLQSLSRTRVGDYKIEDSITLEKFKEAH